MKLALLGGIGLLLSGSALTVVREVGEPAPRVSTVLAHLSDAELSRLATDARFESGAIRRAITYDKGQATGWATAAPAVLESGDDAGHGRIVARIVVEGNSGKWQLSQGTHYLWIDRGESGNDDLRAVAFSADGRSRQVLGPVRFMSSSEHPGGTTVADHAREYCDGTFGCFFTRSTARGDGTRLETIWIRCFGGCCEVDVDET